MPARRGLMTVAEIGEIFGTDCSFKVLYGRRIE